MKKSFFLMLIIALLFSLPLIAQDGNIGKDRTAAIYEIYLPFSMFNNNNDLGSKVDISDINAVNVGLGLRFGFSDRIGFEYDFEMNSEYWNNRKNSISLTSNSFFASFNFGYRIMVDKKEKFSILPRIGFGASSSSLVYSDIESGDILFDNLKQNSWAVDQFLNLNLPIGLDLGFETNRYFWTLGISYRQILYKGKIRLLNSSGIVSDFPNYSPNYFMLKFGWGFRI